MSDIANSGQTSGNNDSGRFDYADTPNMTPNAIQANEWRKTPTEDVPITRQEIRS